MIITCNWIFAEIQVRLERITNVESIRGIHLMKVYNLQLSNLTGMFENKDAKRFMIAK